MHAWRGRPRGAALRGFLTVSTVLLASCTDDALVNPLPGPRLNVAETEPQVVTVDMSNLLPFRFNGPQYDSGRLRGWHSWTDPTVFFTDVRTEQSEGWFWNDYEQEYHEGQPEGWIHWASAYPGRQSIRGSIAVGWLGNAYAEPRYTTILFSQKVTSVRLAVLPGDRATLRCTTADGTVVSSRTVVLDPTNRWGSWEELAVSSPAIRTCSVDAWHAFIKDVRVVPEPRQQLRLTCMGDQGANRVTRGEELRCTASSTTAGTFTISGWKFEGKPREDGDTNSATWEGVMVRGGTVSVEGRVGNQPATPATATITVLDRDWSNKAPTATIREITNGEDSRLVLSERIVYAHDLGAANFFTTAKPEDLPHDPVGYVNGGPNDRLTYYKDLSFPVFAYFVLNRDAMSQGSSFYNRQESGAGGGGGKVGGMNWCTRSIVTTSLPRLVEAHERLHIDVYLAALRRELPPVLSKLEKRVGSDEELAGEYESEFGEIDRVARGESLAIHNQSGNPHQVTPRNSRGDCALRNDNGIQLQSDT